MQHTVTITIPDLLETRVREIRDFDDFVSKLTIEALQNREHKPHDKELEEASQIMYQEYASDPELTSFTVLDGEPVYE